MTGYTAQHYRNARKGTSDFVVIEGAHALKHAMRFGAQCVDVITPDKRAAVALMRHIATDPDAQNLDALAREVPVRMFCDCASGIVRTGVVALARKPCYDRTRLVAADAPVVFLEDARDVNNVGAVVRVAAAWGAAGVACSGTTEPWHVAAIRAAAGLHWAVPVMHVETTDDVFARRAVYACDADGTDMRQMSLQRRSVMIFGTEREGISPCLRARADASVAIPMRPGVSSMNLATSVATMLYGNVYHADDAPMTGM